MTTFEEFRASRRFVPDLSRVTEFTPSDGLEGVPGFVYKVPSKYPNVHGGFLAVYVEIARMAIAPDIFSFDYQGYPHLDSFASLDECERYAWRVILEEDWGVEGVP